MRMVDTRRQRQHHTVRPDPAAPQSATGLLLWASRSIPVRAHPPHPTARRLACTVLLALAALALLGSPAPHLGHDASKAQTPIFAEASHAGQANHWEAADTAPTSRCPDCLTPPQPVERAPASAGRQIQTGAGVAIPGTAGGPTDPGAGRSQRSRAPPPPELPPRRSRGGRPVGGRPAADGHRNTRTGGRP